MHSFFRYFSSTSFLTSIYTSYTTSKNKNIIKQKFKILSQRKSLKLFFLLIIKKKSNNINNNHHQSHTHENMRRDACKKKKKKRNCQLREGEGGGGFLLSCKNPPSTEIPILLCSWSNRFPWKGVTRVLCLPTCLHALPRISTNSRIN